MRSWYFEVWNEPNLSGFFSGTQQQYFDLYAATAHAIKGDDQRCFNAGMDGYLAKPIRSEDLYALLDRFPASSPEQPERDPVLPAGLKPAE